MSTAIDKLREARRIYDMAAEASSSLASAEQRAANLDDHLRRNEVLARVFTVALQRPLWTIFAFMVSSAFLGALLAAGAREIFRWALNAFLGWWGGNLTPP